MNLRLAARHPLALGALALALALSPGAASASEGEAPAKETPARAGAKPAGSPLGLMLSVGASFDNPAFAAGVGARYRLSPGWVVGVDSEWNPWFSLSTGSARRGLANAYLTGIRRWNACDCGVQLRTTAHLGVSRLLFDLYGAPRGSIGPLVGISLLGIEVDLGRRFSLVFDPAHVMVPVPQLQGVPLSYHQYRATLGLQFGG